LRASPVLFLKTGVFDGYFQNDSCRRVYGFRRSTPGLLRSAIEARSRKANILRRVACHSAPNGKPYAGGVAINSPFGPIYAPNLTPDKAALSSGAIGKPDSPQLIGQFSDLVFNELVSQGMD
jgi:hypothetical protein